MAKTITSFSTPGTVLQGSTSTRCGLEVRQRGLDLPTQAVQLRVAKQYIEQFGQLAKAGTTMIVPAPLGDVSAMLATAMSVMRASEPPPLPSGQA
jgi:hypothetical protein